MTPLLWKRMPWEHSGVPFSVILLEEAITYRFAALEAGRVAQPWHVQVDSCGVKDCGECYPIPTVYVMWERYEDLERAFAALFIGAIEQPTEAPANMYAYANFPNAIGTYRTRSRPLNWAKGT